MTPITIERLETLRDAMRRVNVDAVIIPGTDPHQSEYPAAHWKFRDWLTGFTGSNGTAIVTLEAAGLWTDSRYFLQAEQQLEGSGIDLYREGLPDTPLQHEFLAAQLDEDDVVAIDGRLFTLNEVNRLDRFCGEHGFMLATDFAAAERIWDDRPPRPMSMAEIHDVALAGEDMDSKVERVLDQVEAMGADALLVTALDDIAWLFNLRGNDVDYTPVLIAYAYISRRERSLFIDDKKIDKQVKQYLKDNDVHVRDYDDIVRYLERKSEHEVVVLDPNRVSDTLAAALPSQKVYATSPIVPLRAIKNDTQIACFRSAMERDGVALVRLFMWIEENAGKGITEYDVWQRGKEERGRGELYREESFAMIAGYREHGAIVHYQVSSPEEAATIERDGLLLVDSGGQYLDATTDITRTVTLGTPTAEERRDYTLVLKGHLALARAHFPSGITGAHLDALARMPLWQNGLHFMHGTGHGVGQFLGCHEGPQSIRPDQNATPLQPGMVTSNEPGLYRTGKYGIRIENLLLTVHDQTTEFGDFLKFETLTLFPYDLKLIDRAMLDEVEVQQINDYHDMVRERLLPLLTPEQAAWLNEKTAKL